jgi:hypothetical protein
MFHHDAASFTVVSDSTIIAKVPKTKGGKIAVTTPGGTSQSSDKFTVSSGPQIRSFSPESGRVGTEVTIKGKDLDSATEVTIGGVPCTFFSRRPGHHLRAVVPAGAVSGKIAVISPSGTALSEETFTVR